MMACLELSLGLEEYDKFTCACGFKTALLDELFQHVKEEKHYTICQYSGKKGFLFRARNHETDRLIELEYD